jgi:hypothetical protein
LEKHAPSKRQSLHLTSLDLRMHQRLGKTLLTHNPVYLLFLDIARVFCCFIRLDSFVMDHGSSSFHNKFLDFCINLNFSDGMYMSSHFSVSDTSEVVVVDSAIISYVHSSFHLNEKHAINLQLNPYRTRRALGKRLKLRLRCGTSTPVIRAVTVNLNNCQTVSHLKIIMHIVESTLYTRRMHPCGSIDYGGKCGRISADAIVS